VAAQLFAEHLIEDARRDGQVVVGLDFAFSLPAWFLDQRGLSNAPELWELVEQEGEQWLLECTPPFWGRPGVTRPVLLGHFRQTELDVPAVRGTRPKSVFQIGWAGAVGTGSLRGMPVLRRLRDAGIRGDLPGDTRQHSSDRTWIPNQPCTSNPRPHIPRLSQLHRETANPRHVTATTQAQIRYHYPVARQRTGMNRPAYDPLQSL
jgi:hypothetical protein